MIASCMLGYGILPGAQAPAGTMGQRCVWVGDQRPIGPVTTDEDAEEAGAWSVPVDLVVRRVGGPEQRLLAAYPEASAVLRLAKAPPENAPAAAPVSPALACTATPLSCPRWAATDVKGETT